jgi:osmoprotectant transport system permease protein
VIAALLGLGGLLPFAVRRPNRLASGEPLPLWAALGPSEAAVLVAALAVTALVLVAGRDARARLAVAAAAAVVLLLLLGEAARILAPAADHLVRVAPGSGFWLLLVALGLAVTDALARLRLRPVARLLALLAGAGLLALLLGSGQLDRLSLLREHASQADRFWAEVRVHLGLAVAPVAAAAAVGLPLAVLCHRAPRWRGAVLQLLGTIQTIPSIALFGLLMVPLAALAAAVPALAAVGVRGIGAAPAALALFLYALLPIVAAAVAGLAQVPAAVLDAARGMGLGPRQRLFQVELPLALPGILGGLRTALVQSVGLATVAALIGGGGLGTFVFQGVGQSALDLVLLGALPVVAFGLTASLALDAAVAALRRGAP